MDKFTVELKQGSIAVGVIQGQGAREYQEDRFGFSPVKPGEQSEQFTAAVADGMGGLNAGAFVSEYTVKRLLEAEITPGEDVPEQLCAAVRRISGELAAGGSRGGSTLAAVYCMPQGVYFCSVGDSRIYLRRGSVITQLTQDQDYFSVLLDKVTDGKLSFDQAAQDIDRGSLAQYMGSGTFLTPDMNLIPLAVQPGDRLLICSDGVYNALDREELLQSLMLSAGGAAEDIHGRILAHGYSNQDNFTAVVLEFRPGWSNEPMPEREQGDLFTDRSCYTNVGGREENQDRVYSGGGIYAAADGLGGHKNGAKASAAAVKYLSENTGADFSPEGVNALLEGANSAVRKSGGLSAIAAAFVRGGEFTYGNVGDCRVYYFRQGRLIMQTKDHSVCQAAVEMGQLDPEQIRSSEDRPSLLKALGSQERLDLRQRCEPIAIRPGDAFLVCTDGFWEKVHEREMEADLLKSHSSTEWLRFMLKRHLLLSSGSGDNYTAVCGIFTDRPAQIKPPEKRRFNLRLLIAAAVAALMLCALAASLFFLSGSADSENEGGISASQDNGE